MRWEITHVDPGEQRRVSHLGCPEDCPQDCAECPYECEDDDKDISGLLEDD